MKFPGNEPNQNAAVPSKPAAVDTAECEGLELVIEDLSGKRPSEILAGNSHKVLDRMARRTMSAMFLAQLWTEYKHVSSGKATSAERARFLDLCAKYGLDRKIQVQITNESLFKSFVFLAIQFVPEDRRDAFTEAAEKMYAGTDDTEPNRLALIEAALGDDPDL